MSDKRDGKWIDCLRPDMPLAEAARHVLLVRMQVVADYLPRALDEADKDPENVHHLRVGTRRAAAALQIFRGNLPGKTFKQARKCLRRLRRAAGAVRDWDVFLQNLQAVSKQRPDNEQPGVDFIIGYAFGQRTAAQTDLEAVGREEGREFEPFLLDTVAAVRELKSHAPVSTLLGLARPLLSGFLKNLEDALAGDLNDYPHLHQIRIAGKRLRYAMEVFVDCYSAPFKEVLYPLVEEMQELLGNLNDSYVGGDRLQSLRDRLQFNPLVGWERIGPGVEALLHWHHERSAQEKDSFGRWLERWRKSGAETMLDGLVKS
jgi:CHAD domain-containing protein